MFGWEKIRQLRPFAGWLLEDWDSGSLGRYMVTNRRGTGMVFALSRGRLLGILIVLIWVEEVGYSFFQIGVMQNFR